MEHTTKGNEYERIAERRKQNKGKKGYAANKPWGLVIFIVVLLAGFLFYIKWLNSPAAEEYGSFWAYLVEPTPTEVRSDSLAAPADDIAVLFGSDSSSNAGFNDEWAETNPSATAPSPDNGFPSSGGPAPATNPTLPPAPPVSRPAVATPGPTPVSQGTVYTINAGEFKTKGSAQFRIGELRQGNYAARLVEPASPDGRYKVIVGEYQSEGTARSVAQSMGFILEIRASVEEKRQ